MTDFFAQYLDDFKTVSAATGILPSVIMAQVADETDYGTSVAFVRGNNWAGISYAGVSSFPSKAAGLNAYIATLKLGIYDPVRNAAAFGWRGECIQLGLSPWAAGHYDAADYYAAGQPADGTWTPPNPGIDLISIIQANNLTQYDGAQAQNVTDSGSGSGTTNTVGALASLPKIQPPPQGLSSDVEAGQFLINGETMDLNVSAALVTAALLLSMQQASTFTLTLHDPDRTLIALPVFAQTSTVTFEGTSIPWFSLVSLDKQGSVLTVEFESYIVAALRTARGPITAAAGQLTRTAFARYLVQQVIGAGFVSPPDAWLYAQDEGYDRPTQEQISRGTSTAPLEDSWSCLQRLATEIGWVCFESLATVYFGPESYLASQPPVMTPVEGEGGIISIDGTYDIGQPNGELTIKATADEWVGQVGEAIAITNLGPLNGAWIVQQIERDDVEEPELTITIIQPQPNLPEPASGGAAAAVSSGASATTSGSQQSAGGSAAAKQALAYCVAQLGKPYVWGDDNPATGFDCSGLVYAAYLSVGVNITRSTFSQWAAAQAGQIAQVPAGIGNLRPGDLVYFAGGDGTASEPGHVAIVSSINKGTNVVTVIDAFSTGFPIRYDTFGYVSPGGNTDFAGKYFGALRPSP